MSFTWSALTSPDEVARRAGGRRAYNRRRQFQAVRRRAEVCRLLFVRQKGTPLARGNLARIARMLGVHRSTICRDVQFLVEEWGRECCPTCEAMYSPRNRRSWYGGLPWWCRELPEGDDDGAPEGDSGPQTAAAAVG